MTVDRLEEILQVYEIAWCYNCAAPFIKNPKKKMFAWIASMLLRDLNRRGYSIVRKGTKIQLHINLNEFEDVDAMSKYLYKASYWKFLIYNINERLDWWEVDDFTTDCKVRIDKKIKAAIVDFVEKK